MFSSMIFVLGSQFSILIFLTISMATDQEIQYAIMNGISFGKSRTEQKEDPTKVKTKARKKSYQTGAHKSGAAKHKAEIRQRVKSRASQRKSK